MKKVLVTGCTGMLGEKIVAELLLNNQFDVFGLARTKTNILSDSYQIQVDLSEDSFKDSLKSWITPDVIIHTAAYVNLSFCEQHPDKATTLHVHASGKLAALYPQALFIYISTDSVFDGEKGNYSEMDIATPLNQYALTKLQGEREIQRFTTNALIIRTNIYGKRNGKNGGLAEWAISNLSKNIAINGFDDVIFNPLYTGQLAEFIKTFILGNNEFRGILNLGSEEFVSKYVFINMLAQEFGLNSNLVKRDTMKGKPSDLLRPFNTTLDTTTCKKLFNQSFHLLEGIKQLKENYN
jgi:dTDP-4-dehydrorhamnose reductase